LLYLLSYCSDIRLEQPGLEPGTYVVPSAFATGFIAIFGPRLRRRSVEKHFCCSVQLSYHTPEGHDPDLNREPTDYM